MMGRLVNKSKTVHGTISNVDSGEECSACRSAGKVLCVICQSKGFVKKFKSEQIKCDVCAGAGKISSSCLACSGTGTTSRHLRYEDKGAQGAIEQQGILFGAKRTQIVSVMLKNTDQVPGKFQLVVTLRDGRHTNSKGSVTLRPGETAPVALSFYPISSKDGYPATYEVIPEEIQTPCQACSTKGKVERTCLSCQGMGQATSQRQVSEICSNCGGAGETKCNSCNGTGRLRA